MKRPLIILIIFGAVRMISAQNLQLFCDQKLDYQVKLVTLKNVYGILGSSHGAANLTVRPITQNEYYFYLKAYVFKNEAKPTYWINNQAELIINNQQVRQAEYLLSDGTRQIWQVANPHRVIYHFNSEKFADSLIYNDEYVPRDALAAALNLIEIAKVKLGESRETYFFTHDSLSRSCWRKMTAKVDNKLQKIKLNKQKIECYHFIINAEEKINLGGSLTVGDPQIWVASSSGKPVKVKVTLYWKFLPVAIITGELKLE